MPFSVKPLSLLTPQKDVEDAQEAILGLRAVYGIGRDFLNVCTAADEPASRAELRK